MRRGFNPKNKKTFYRINNQIFAKTIRLIDEEGKQIEVADINKARDLARESGLDLVEIAPNANPPVVKLIDYSKFLYQQKKKKQEEKKKAVTSITKEVRLGPFIGEHDLDIKINKSREFLEEGNKVKFVVRFKGRAITKKELGEAVLKKVIEKLNEIAKVERDIHLEGKQMIMILSKSK